MRPSFQSLGRIPEVNVLLKRDVIGAVKQLTSSFSILGCSSSGPVVLFTLMLNSSSLTFSSDTFSSGMFSVVCGAMCSVYISKNGLLFASKKKCRYEFMAH